MGSEERPFGLILREAHFYPRSSATEVKDLLQPAIKGKTHINRKCVPLPHSKCIFYE